MGFSDDIREIRRNSGLTRIQFADKLGVSLLKVSIWESRHLSPDEDDVEKINKYLTSLRLPKLREYKPSFGERIKEIRTLLGMTQMEFGKQTGIPFTAINQYENGRRNISELHVKRLKDFLVSNELEIGEYE